MTPLDPRSPRHGRLRHLDRDRLRRALCVVAEAGFGPAVQRYVARRACARRPAPARCPARGPRSAAYAVAGALLVRRDPRCSLAAPIVEPLRLPRCRSRTMPSSSLRTVGRRRPDGPRSRIGTGQRPVRARALRHRSRGRSVAGAPRAAGDVDLGPSNAGRGLPGLGHGAAGPAGRPARHPHGRAPRRGRLRPPALRRPGTRCATIVVFSAKLQVAAFTVLINGQSDRVVAALVAPAAVVGRLGRRPARWPEAGRFVAGALLQPRRRAGSRRSSRSATATALGSRVPAASAALLDRRHDRRDRGRARRPAPADR